MSGRPSRDIAATLPLPLGVLGHEGSTVVAGLSGLRLLREAAWVKTGAGEGRLVSSGC
ncbi:hypothetical protein [Streptomyces sp. BK340]|uniref:hypothetical protein n=1 Tax=Streptomyces sp. BK340 TaxID=2572903 RepID=UPI0016454A31|nr:hypothetical protein [Streptomyces sp. BK340]